MVSTFATVRSDGGTDLSDFGEDAYDGGGEGGGDFGGEEDFDDDY
jgi:hypothetical protein